MGLKTPKWYSLNNHRLKPMVIEISRSILIEPKRNFNNSRLQPGVSTDTLLRGFNPI